MLQPPILALGIEHYVDRLGMYAVVAIMLGLIIFNAKAIWDAWRAGEIHSHHDQE